MPLRRLIAADHTAAQTAKIMHIAYDAVLAYAAENNVAVASDMIARRVFDAVTAGEQDATKVVAAITKTLKPKES